MKNLNLNYGVEIEISSSSKFDDYDIKYWLESKDLDWKVEEDSSCGWEVISPILNGYDGYEQIKKVTRILKKLNCYVNKDCGLHIHIGAENLSIENIHKVVSRYYYNQALIDSFIPKSRHYNYFSNPLDDTFSRHFLNGNVCVDSISGLIAYQYNRYSHVNLYPLRKYGTIEFRQHQGTLDATKIVNWIEFLKHFVEHSVFYNSIYGSNFDDLFGHKLWLRDYYKKRAAFLEKYYNTHTVYNY